MPLQLGLIKSVSPIIDTGLLEEKAEKRLGNIKTKPNSAKLTKTMMLKMNCDLCQGPIPDKPHPLKIANFERFFCYTTCRAIYKKTQGYNRVTKPKTQTLIFL